MAAASARELSVTSVAMTSDFDQAWAKPVNFAWIWPNLGEFVKLGQIMATLGNFGRIGPDLGQVWTGFGTICEMSVGFGPNLAIFGQIGLMSTRVRPTLVRRLLKFGQHWLISADAGPKSVNCGPDLAKRWRFRSVGPDFDTSVEFNQKAFNVLKRPRCQRRGS